MRVTLRQKKRVNGDASLYLDFYPPILHPETGKPTRREFLKLYLIGKPESRSDREHNKETKILAEHLRARRQIDIQNGYYDFLKRNETNVDFVNYFHTITEKRKERNENYHVWISAYNYLKRFGQGKPIFTRSMDLRLCEDFKSFLNTTNSLRRKKQKLSQNSKHSYFNKFLTVLKRAYKEGLLKENIAESLGLIPEGETRREYLSLEEVRLLVKTDCEDEELKRASLFSCVTGMRWSDVTSLKWSEVRHSESEGCYKAVFRQAKTKGMQWNPISNEAYQLLGNPGNPDERIFRINYSAEITRELTKWIQKAGILKHITFHCFRHTYATLQLTLGTDIAVVSKMLGHRNLKTTQIYAKVIDQRKIETIGKIEIGL